MKAHLYTPDGDGKPSIEKIPRLSQATPRKLTKNSSNDRRRRRRNDGRVFPRRHHSHPRPHPRRPQAIVAEKIFPVLMTSSLRNIGTASLLTFLADAFPHPDEHAQVGFKDPGGKGDRLERKYDDTQPLSSLSSKRLQILSPAVSTTSRLRAES